MVSLPPFGPVYLFKKRKKRWPTKIYIYIWSNQGLWPNPALELAGTLSFNRLAKKVTKLHTSG